MPSNGHCAVDAQAMCPAKEAIKCESRVTLVGPIYIYSPAPTTSGSSTWQSHEGPQHDKLVSLFSGQGQAGALRVSGVGSSAIREKSHPIIGDG